MKYRRYFSTKGAAEQFGKETRNRLAEYSEPARHMTGEQPLEAYRCFQITEKHGFTMTAAI